MKRVLHTLHLQCSCHKNSPAVLRFIDPKTNTTRPHPSWIFNMRRIRALRSSPCYRDSHFHDDQALEDDRQRSLQAVTLSTLLKYSN